MTLPEESESFHSVTERWRERTAQTKGLGLVMRVMQRWCQGENQTIQDLEDLAPFVFRHKCVHTLEENVLLPSLRSRGRRYTTKREVPQLQGQACCSCSRIYEHCKNTYELCRGFERSEKLVEAETFRRSK